MQDVSLFLFVGRNRYSNSKDLDIGERTHDGIAPVVRDQHLIIEPDVVGNEVCGMHVMVGGWAYLDYLSFVEHLRSVDWQYPDDWVLVVDDTAALGPRWFTQQHESPYVG